MPAYTAYNLTLLLYHKGSTSIHDKRHSHTYEITPGTKTQFWYHSDFTGLSYLNHIFSHCKKEKNKENYL